MSMHRFRAIFVAGAIVAAASFAATTAIADAPAAPDFGANVHIFNPGMGQATIQAQLNAIAAAQVNNEFGPRRDAVLFEPGTYGSSTNPLNFQVGYYTEVAGLGLSPDDVVINGSIDVFDRCLGANGTNCLALVNFWRSMSNLELNVVTPRGGCRSGEFWAVSQAAPMRRVHVNGFATLMDYCLQPAFASGGFIADSEFDASTVVNGSQQQWVTRNSKLDGWTNAVWNQVFSGVVGAPPQSFPSPPYTTLSTSPVTREAPYLYVDGAGNYNVRIPGVQHDSVGTTWGSGPTPGSTIPLDRFFLARPTDSVQMINNQLAIGKDLLFTPGIYHLDRSIRVVHRDTVVIGLAFPTLLPDQGNRSMVVEDGTGVNLSGIMFDAGPDNSPELLQMGAGPGQHSLAGDPGSLHDVFFRIGGATPGMAGARLVLQRDK